MDASDKEKELLQQQSEGASEAVSKDFLAIEQYLEACVMSLPKWAQDLFEERRAFFTINKAGDFFVQFETGVSDVLKQELITLLQGYLTANNNPIFEDVLVH